MKKFLLNKIIIISISEEKKKISKETLKRRHHIVNEIFETEMHYVESLNVAVKVNKT